MTIRGATFQGSLAAVALVAAYATWQREPERPSGEVTVVDVGKGDVSKVRFEEGSRWIELTPSKEDGEKVVWMRLSGREKPKTPEREVRGNEGALRLLERMEPLSAARRLGVLPADKLKELGLDAPKKKLTITARGTTYTFDVGNSPYGVSDPYVKDARDGKVYVLGNMILSDLEAAPVRFVDRSLHAFKQGDFDGITVSAGGKKRDFTQEGGDKPFTAKLLAGGKPDETAKSWHDKVWRAVGLDALGKGETPAAGTPATALRIDYTMKGKAAGFVELARVVVPPPANATASQPSPPPEVYARSEHTAGWVKLPPMADEWIKEGEKIAAGAQ